MTEPFQIPIVDDVAPAKATLATSHTSGPWVLHLDGPLCLSGDPDLPENYREIVAGDGFFSDGGKTGFNIVGFFTEADARLIAAAPDLLEALRLAEGRLEEMRQDLRRHPIKHCPVLDTVRAAIAKAVGANQ